MAVSQRIWPSRLKAKREPSAVPQRKRYLFESLKYSGLVTMSERRSRRHLIFPNVSQQKRVEPAGASSSSSLWVNETTLGGALHAPAPSAFIHATSPVDFRQVRRPELSEKAKCFSPA